MLLGELLHEEVVKVGLEAETKFEAIEELIDLLVEAHEIPMSLRDHIVEVVTERERSMSTGMEHGIALPHGSSDRIDDMVGALGIAPNGIPFETLDGQPSHLIVLLVLPRRKYQAHVRTLAGIAHLLENPDFRDRLIHAPDAATALDMIEREEDRESFDQYRADLDRP